MFVTVLLFSLKLYFKKVSVTNFLGSSLVLLLMSGFEINLVPECCCFLWWRMCHCRFR